MNPLTIQATVANVHDIPGQALTSVTFQPVQPDQDGQHHTDHTGWAGGGQIGFAFELNVSRDAAGQFQPGRAVVITITEADRG